MNWRSVLPKDYVEWGYTILSAIVFYLFLLIILSFGG